MSKANGTVTAEQQIPKLTTEEIVARATEMLAHTLVKGSIGIFGTLDMKFTINIQTDGKMSLTIRTEDEEELERLIEKWESRIVVYQEPIAPSGQQNGNGHRDEKTRYYPGDQCPNCSNKLVRRNGSKGKFLGCNNYPDCTFVQRL